MTRLPHENRDVKGLRAGKALPSYKVGPDCAAPGCGRHADHAHHIWRRSALAGPFEYVQLWDGTIIGNLTGLCWRCHNEVTENRATIAWSQEDLTFDWIQDGEYVGELAVRPPFVRLGAAGPSSTPPPQAGSSEAKCKTCNGTGKRVKVDLPPGEKRPKKTWAISVPVDHRENGYELVESLMEDAREKLGRDSHASWKYFTLVEVLAFFSQHGLET